MLAEAVCFLLGLACCCILVEIFRLIFCILWDTRRCFLGFFAIFVVPSSNEPLCDPFDRLAHPLVLHASKLSSSSSSSSSIYGELNRARVHISFEVFQSRQAFSRSCRIHFSSRSAHRLLCAGIALPPLAVVCHPVSQGWSLANEMLIMGRKLSAQEARASGLVSTVVMADTEEAFLSQAS